MPPEVVKQSAHTPKADIWSVGCLVVEMLTGEHPWASLTQMQAIFKVRCSVLFLNPSTNSYICRLVHRLNLLFLLTYLLKRTISLLAHSMLITRLDLLHPSCCSILSLLENLEYLLDYHSTGYYTYDNVVPILCLFSSCYSPMLSSIYITLLISLFFCT